LRTVAARSDAPPRVLSSTGALRPRGTPRTATIRRPAASGL